LAAITFGVASLKIKMANVTSTVAAPSAISFCPTSLRVITLASIAALVVLVGLTYASVWGWLPYAPVKVMPSDASSNLFWINSELFFAAPFLVLITVMADQLLAWWREREERIARARETARTHVGRLFGILTPGETDILVAQAEAEAAGCRIERDGSLVKMGEGRGEPCFILPGHPALSVEQFKGGLGFMVRYGADGNGVDAMRMKLSALGPVSSYENRGSINHYWQDAGMTVVETGHERHGSPVSFLFISKATFEKELERILQEKAEAEAEHRRENETLQKMF
jgi:hypothetical protein